MKKPTFLPAVFLALATVTAAFGHVTVSPTASKTNATQVYTFSVPSEGGRTTTSVVLSVPEGVTIQGVGVPTDGSAASFKKGTAGAADEVVWTIEIKPGTTAKLSFTATNSKAAGVMTWKILQKYSDGSSPSWTPTTTLTAGP